MTRGNASHMLPSNARAVMNTRETEAGDDVDFFQTRPWGSRAGGEIIRQMTLEEAQGLIDTGVAHGGMIPKLETAMAAVRAGVEAVVILDGRRPHAMLVELFTEFGAGTLVKAS